MRRILRRNFEGIWNEGKLLLSLYNIHVNESLKSEIENGLKYCIEREINNSKASVVINSCCEILFKVIIGDKLSPTINLNQEDTRRFSEWYRDNVEIVCENDEGIPF